MKIQKAIIKDPTVDVIRVESLKELEKISRDFSLGITRNDVDGDLETVNYIGIEEGDWLILDRRPEGGFYYVDTVYSDEAFNKYMELVGE